MKFFLWTAGIALSICGAGCSLPTANQNAQRIYRLQPVHVDVTGASPALTRPLVIQLMPMGAAPGLGSPAMLYSEGSGAGISHKAYVSINQDAYRPIDAGAVLMPYRDSRWLAPPAQLIGAAIAQTLSLQPWVSAVESNAPLAPAAWILHCTLDRLEHDVDGDRGVVRLALTCQLIRNDPRDIAAHWRFDASRPIMQNNAQHYAAAAQDLLDGALYELVKHVYAKLSASGAFQPRN